MLSKFFIYRPIFATVISIVIVIAGAVSQQALPVAKLPEIAPPTVQVTCSYPGANAAVVGETVASPIEQEVNGVEDMLYLSSVSADDGSYTLTVTFDIGTDLDNATTLVQNRVAIAEPRLPEEVRRQGIVTRKQSTQILQFIALTSPDGSVDELDLANYAFRFVKDELARLKGVGSVQIFGAEEYSMRVWLDPRRLKARQLTTEDVVRAIREQNVQVAAGRIGEPPTPDGVSFQYAVNTQGRLTTTEQFGDIIIKTADTTRVTRVKDVARVELGAESYGRSSTLNGQVCTNIGVYQLPGANALDVSTRVRDAMRRLAGDFPPGMDYKIPFDTTRFVEESITQVYATLLTAVVLVVLVIFIFLQDWRTTLVPCAAIPVALIGTFAVMALLGFSINMLTLFGLVLAIGIVVDDSIVVVENTARWIEEGLDSKSAAARAMDEMIGPIIATTLVLLAVFVPTAFLTGITGQLYRQFALTISAAVAISTINALTLSPALCGVLMRKAPERRNIFFRGFNRVFDGLSVVYSRLIGGSLRVTPLVLLVFVGLVVLTGWGFVQLPTGFMPTEDQGYAFANIQLPDAATLDRTQQVMEEVSQVLGETPGVEDVVTVAGFSLLSGANASNVGMVPIVFDPWDERTGEGLTQDAIMGEVRERLSQIEEAFVIAFFPPPIDGLGNATGFQMQLQDRQGMGLMELQNATQNLIAAASAQSSLTALNTTFRAGVPQLYLDLDRTRVKAAQVPLDSVFGTMQAYLGSTYVNDFNRFGRTYQVRIQADHQFRATPEDVLDLDVRNSQGDMSPLGAFVQVRDSFGPQIVPRYNLYPSAQINGEPAPGVSSGQALALMEQAARDNLPPGIGYEWTGVSYQEKQAGGEQYVIFALAITLVFLVLAAQYESWMQPAAVIAVVPLAALGVVAMLAVRSADNNVYTQIGVVLLVALASKNAILIVEFAAELRKQGRTIREAAAEAARLRFRAILMTAFSSILGFLPLLASSGAGAASRQAVGNAVVGGMIAATVCSLVFVPTFFVLFKGLAEWGKSPPEKLA